MKSLSVMFAFILLAVAQVASADWDRDHGRDRDPGRGNLHYVYAGQAPGPIHGSPWGYNYCGTETPNYCNYYGEQCYINTGYWWDNANQENWFNVYRCEY